MAVKFSIVILTIIGLALLMPIQSIPQCKTPNQYWNEIESITAVETVDQKIIDSLLALKKQVEQCRFTGDSVYGRILDRIGLYEYAINGDYNQAIDYTLKATAVYNSYPSAFSPNLLRKSYNNLAFFCYRTRQNSKSRTYLDSVIQLVTRYKLDPKFIDDCRLERCIRFYENGDYEKVVEESTLLINNLSQGSERLLPTAYNQRAQAYHLQGFNSEAWKDAEKALALSRQLGDFDQEGAAIKTMGRIRAEANNVDEADQLFRKAIATRLKAGDAEGAIADDYIDYGNFLLRVKGDNKQAIIMYKKAADYASQIDDKDRLAVVYTNLGQVSFRNNNPNVATNYYQQALREINPAQSDSYAGITVSDIQFVANKELLLVWLGNKVESLLYQYKITQQKPFLKSALSIARLTDSVINNLRHEQVGENSKLYWRTRTREFYTNALEACWLAQDKSLAFYFLEKSRSVLLNDRLNELGASTKLPKKEADKEEAYQVKIMSLQQQLFAMQATDAAYHNIQTELLNTKEELERFIGSIEHRYPVYYAYKYADDHVSIPAVQQYLKNNDQQLLHYFDADTAVYYLSITPGKVEFIKKANQDYNRRWCDSLMQLCANGAMLNKNYAAFTELSYRLFESLFEPLTVTAPRVIICADQSLIPFELLSKDKSGKHLLVNDYAFSYIYSASILLRQYPQQMAKGNFLGIAPEKFSHDLLVPSLSNSGIAIRSSSENFSDTKILTGTVASRKNFFIETPNYAVINIFSHALAAPGSGQPRLYMQDSVVNLSDLALINNPAAQLVILSACETNVGEQAIGEGIYSLARGFAAIGVPSVAATLWKADEQAIYQITNEFNKQLADHVPKDVALQRAQIAYLKNNPGEKSLPYYWSSMVLVGQADALRLATPGNNMFSWVIIIGVLISLLAIIVVVSFVRRTDLTIIYNASSQLVG